MNKLINKYTLPAALLAVFLSSCEKQLDLKPISNTIVGGEGQGTAGSFINNAATAESALASCFGIFRQASAEYYVMDYFLIGDAQSDNAYAGADNAAWFEVDDFKMLSTNQGASRDWGYLYNHITSANAIIDNVPKVTDPNLTETRKQQIVGQAKFIRARAYFDLVRMYGEVPLVVHELPTINSDNLEENYPILYPARNTVEEVYAQIIADLEDAAGTVPTSGADKMVVMPGAVYTLLAKVYATKSPADWSKVAEYADMVINGGYSLLPNYDELWDGNHENSSESIFELNFDGGATGGNWGTSMFYGTDWKKFNVPSNDLVKAFDDEGDEVRKNSTITFRGPVGWSDTHWPTGSNAFPFAYKMRNTGGGQNIIIYRLADVLLLKAEALNELNSSGWQQAKTLVDQIRSRAHLDGTPANDQNTMRLAIEKERRLELAFEGQRWYDLLRTGRAIEVMSQVQDGNGNPLNYPITESKLIWPIPQSQLDLNDNLVQNPGY